MIDTLRQFIHFSRLHTVIGTTLSVTALYVLALSLGDGPADLRIGLWLLSLLSCLGANIYIVGLNQITDVEIDRINKPYLPLASGAYTLRTAYTIIFLSVILSLAIALWLGSYLLLTVVLSLVLGTIYSLPPVRLKRFHFWAAFCIIAVRGLIVNLLLFLHFHSHLNGRGDLPIVIWLLTGIMFLFSIIIAWFKDIPDTEGDERYAIHTLSLRLGRRAVWLSGSIILSLGFLAMVILPFVLSTGVNTLVLAGAHLLSLALFWWFNRRLDLTRQASIARYYQSVWGLFFLEYIAFAAAGLAG